MLFFLLVLVSVPILSINDEEFRKHYGLSFHNHCGDYVKSFKCMTTCKMMGFQIFRMNYNCKCSCHDMKTSTFLPFFMWRTNGTTKTIPKTQSAGLYAIGGFPKTTTPAPFTGITCPPVIFPNWTMPDMGGNSTVGGNATTSAGSSDNSTSVPSAGSQAAAISTAAAANPTEAAPAA